MILGRCLTLVIHLSRGGEGDQRGISNPFLSPAPIFWAFTEFQGPPRLFYEETGQRRQGAHRECVTGTRPDDPQVHEWLIIYPTAPLSSPESLFPIPDLKLRCSTQGAAVGQQTNIKAVILSPPVVHFIGSKIEQNQFFNRYSCENPPISIPTLYHCLRKQGRRAGRREGGREREYHSRDILSKSSSRS